MSQERDHSTTKPYIFHGPVNDPAMFIGRKHKLNEIAAFLPSNQSISVVGLRKIGKTSLPLHLMQPTSWPEPGIGDDLLFAYLDCEVLGESEHGEILPSSAARWPQPSIPASWCRTSLTMPLTPS
jgi:hypothetical protein